MFANRHFKAVLSAVMLCGAQLLLARAAPAAANTTVNVINTMDAAPNDLHIEFNAQLVPCPTNLGPFTCSCSPSPDGKIQNATIDCSGPGVDSGTIVGGTFSTPNSPALYPKNIQWSFNGTLTNAVVQTPLYNQDKTKPATDLHFTARPGSKFQSIDQDGATVSADGGAIDMSGINVPPGGGAFGPVQITFGKPSPQQYTFHWTGGDAGQKIGSESNPQYAQNDLSVPASALTVTTNIPVDAFLPTDISPFTSVTGLGTTTLVFSGAIVPPGGVMNNFPLFVSSFDPGPTDIEVTSVVWTAAGQSTPALPLWQFVLLIVLIAVTGAVATRRLSMTTRRAS